jgi:polyisoprenoid-binding protein YceI
MRFSFLILLAIAHVCLAQEKLSFEAGTVSFVVNNGGWEVEGTIGGLEGHLRLDEKHDDILEIGGSVDLNTINTGISIRDNHLKKADYFNVPEYQKIVISSVQLQKIRSKKYEGTFDLNIKSTTKKIVFPFLFTKTKDTYTLTGKFSMNRLDFGIGEESIILSDTVEVTIEIKGRI